VVVVLGEAHDAIVGDVAEEEITAGREIDRAFRPAKSGGEPLDGVGAGKRREAGGAERPLGLSQRFETRIRIARARQRTERQRRRRR
jgi:hypothetical protein